MKKRTLKGTREANTMMALVIVTTAHLTGPQAHADFIFSTTGEGEVSTVQSHTFTVIGDGFYDFDGNFVSEEGTLNVVNGGILTTDEELIAGYLGVGTLNVIGGTINVTGHSYIGYNYNGTATVSSGSWATGGNLYIGGASPGYDSPGVLNISGGTVTVSGNLTRNSASTINLNTGGTLLLSGTGDQVNNAATVTLAGGTIQTDGASSVSETVGALTLSSTSTIDFGTLVAGNTLSFGNSSGNAWTGALNVWNWTSGTDHLFFGNSAVGLTSGQLAQINLYSDGGTTFVGNGGINGFGEVSGISPVPEPSSVFVAASLLALIGWRERRWFLRCPEARRVG